MYFGMCVVATNTGNTFKIIEDGFTGKIVPPDDTLALSEALVEVLSQEETRARLAQAAKAFIEAHEPTQDTIIADRITVLMSLITFGKKLSTWMSK